MTMLYKIRTRHTKGILWALAIIIIFAFVFYGSLRPNKSEPAFGEIGGRKVTNHEFSHYLRMAQLYFSLFAPDETKIAHQDLTTTGWEFLLLLWKANKEKIKVSDQEVIAHIKNIFSKKDEFNKEIYLRFLKYGLKMPPRVFEEYIRDFVKIDKLHQQYLKIEITEEEIRDLYKKDTQEAKIDYLFIPNQQFQNKIEIAEADVEDFYAKNKHLFKGEAAVIPALENIKDKVKDKLKENKLKEEVETAGEGLLEAIKSKEITNLKELKKAEMVEFKETGYFKCYDSLEGFSLNEEVNKIIFSLLKVGQIYSKPILQSQGSYIIQLKALTPFDEEGFKKKESEYRQNLFKIKMLTQRIRFLSYLEKEAQLKIYSVRESEQSP